MNILPEWMFVLLALSARLGQGRPASNYSEGRASHSFYTTLGHLKLHREHTGRVYIHYILHIMSQCEKMMTSLLIRQWGERDK